MNGSKPLLPSLSIKTEALTNNSSLHMVNIRHVGPKLISAFDSVIVEICEGNSTSDISIVKQRLLNFFETKKESTTEIGAIAEFICHAILKNLNFKQEFLYLNLEEGSIKKGFDGFYTYRNQKWLFESKSGLITTKGITHESKIKEAYFDLKDKLEGRTTNNPWANAYNHACHCDVGTNKNIRDELKKLSHNFINNIYKNIKSLKIIPGSTIFLENAWSPIECDKLKIQMSQLIKLLDYESIHIICINKKSKKLFLDYLRA
jgi:hypothetical protein